MPNAPTALETKLGKAVLKSAGQAVIADINSLHAKGWIDDAYKTDLIGRLGTVKLSLADIQDDGSVKPNAVAQEIAGLLRLAKSGKPGPYAKAAPAKRGGIDPLKPISSTQLSATEVTLDPPGSDEDQDRFKEMEKLGDDLAKRAMSNGSPK